LTRKINEFRLKNAETEKSRQIMAHVKIHGNAKAVNLCFSYRPAKIVTT